MIVRINAHQYESEHFEIIRHYIGDPVVRKPETRWVIYRKNKCTPLGSSRRLYRVKEAVEKLEGLERR